MRAELWMRLYDVGGKYRRTRMVLINLGAGL